MSVIAIVLDWTLVATCLAEYFWRGEVKVDNGLVWPQNVQEDQQREGYALGAVIGV